MNVVNFVLWLPVYYKINIIKKKNHQEIKFCQNVAFFVCEVRKVLEKQKLLYPSHLKLSALLGALPKDKCAILLTSRLSIKLKSELFLNLFFIYFHKIYFYCAFYKTNCYKSALKEKK